MNAWFLFLVALVVRAAVASQQAWPGYIDATYYTVIARNLADGRGLSENVLWNYVDRPSALPHPSNAHWMPLTSFVTAPFLWVFGDHHSAAQLPFVIASAALVPLAYGWSMRLFGRRGWALLSAALVLGGGTYFPHWAAIDSWSLYPLIGTALLTLGARLRTETARERSLLAVACGALVGLGHLTRADGLLLSVPLAVSLRRVPRRVALLGAAGLGYSAIMGPWLARNVRAFGRPLLGSHLVWLQDYPDLFAYEKDIASAPWSAGDWLARLGEGFQSLFFNFVSLAGALQFVFLPCLFVALWIERRRPIVQAGTAYLAALLFAMSFVFTLPGPRSSFLHSLTAVVVLLFVLAPAGLSHIVAWVAARRARWDAGTAERFFSVALFLIGSVISANAYLATMHWYRVPTSYGAVESALRERGEPPEARIFCVDAPACHYWMRRPVLAIPTDGDDALCHAAERFAVAYLVLEDNHPRFLEALYRSPETDSRFQRLGSWKDGEGRAMHLFRLLTCSPKAC